MVVWFAATFGWTEIAFEPFLKKIVAPAFPDAILIRKSRYYTKGPKPTIVDRLGLTGTPLLRELSEVIGSEVRHGNQLPDVIIVSDDSDCRVTVSDEGRGYTYHDGAYRSAVENLTRLVEKHSAHTAVVLMLAAPEIEAWFLADWKRTFRRDFPGFTMQQLDQMCGGILPIRHVEDWCRRFTGTSCDKKLSEECVGQFIARLSNGHYSKRTHGKVFLERIEPNTVQSLDHFFRPAMAAIQLRKSFVPGVCS